MRQCLLLAVAACSFFPEAEGFSVGGLHSISPARSQASAAVTMHSSPQRNLRGAQGLLLSQTSSAARGQPAAVGRPTFVEFATEAGCGGGCGKGIVRGGGGGGGGGGDGKEDYEAQIAALLGQMGLARSQLPKGCENLGASELKRFLEAYKNSLNKFLINSWPAWRDKMLADPEFAYKIMVEETVGLGLAMSGTVAARGKDLLKELDFFLTDTAVGAVINFVIIWLLAPSVAKSASTSGLGLAIARLPPYVAAGGSYTLAQRLGAGFYKGSLFGVCGFIGSLGGTTLAYCLFQARKALGFDSGTGGQLPNVLANSCGWGSFMFVSTNPRYQVINGIEQVMYKVLPTGVSKTASLVMRTGNNLLGGATWVKWARYIGLQKQAEEPAGKGKGKKAKMGK